MKNKWGRIAACPTPKQKCGARFTEYSMETARLDAVGPNGAVLRIQFIRLADRYRHTISLVERDGQVCPLLESIEGTASDDWPPSPPLQNLSIAELAPGRKAALLVGMAGRGHWSASIEPVSGEAALDFDIACRPAGKPEPLGSLYTRLAPSAAELKITAVESMITLGCLYIFVPTDSTASSARTVRWKYRIALDSAAPA